MRTLSFIFLSFILTTLPTLGAPWPIDKVSSIVDISWRPGLHASPDGRWVAYTVELPDTVKRLGNYSPTGVTLEGSNRKQARITELATGKTVVLGDESAYTWGPSWAPKGQRLAFYSDQNGKEQLFLYDLALNTTRAVSGVVAAPQFTFQTPRWDANGTLVVVPCLPEGAPLIPEAAHLASDPRVMSTTQPVKKATVTHWRPLRVAVVNTQTMSSRIVGEAHYLRNCQLSPDGKTLAYCYYGRNLPGTQNQVFPLRRVDLTSLADTLVADELPLRYGTEWAWSPDSSTIAYMTDKARGGRLGTLSLDGSGENGLAESGPNLDWSHGERPPVWGSDSQHLYAGDGKKIYLLDTESHLMTTLAEAEGWSFRGMFAPLYSPAGFLAEQSLHLVATNIDGATGLWKVAPQGGDLEFVETLPEGVSSAPYRMSTSQDGSRLLFVSSSVKNPGTIWQYNTTDAKTALAVDPNPFLQAGEFGERKVIAWRDADGRELKGVLLLPPGYKGGPLPTVLWVYGGTEGTNSLERFGLGGYPVFNFEVLASRGYAVFYPEIPIRTGHPMEDINKAVLSGVDALIKEGYSDPDRLAVMGQSYGSYTVLCLLVQSQRFKAAVLTGAIVHPDLFAGFSQTPSTFLDGQMNLGVTPWANPEMYRANSPFFFLDRITTPILIGQGSEDNLETTEELYNSLEHAKVDTELRIYSNEDHVLSNPAHVTDFWKRRLEFLEQHLESTSPVKLR